ncbi:uncharacterized protein LOC124336419 isoform X1 [Daphnia pulicaria]|uniref:uncharacterized protein LOC124336419 isoform X1 n=1 Tax=Daphnia pulicaria TaxID=35523 RepID=UPI001EEB1AA9|nr:uncharacterized protein LOC124336419 isoform X1 [Daphnia pulicaria]
MKFALMFLSAMVVLSHQQFQRPRGLIWASPYVQHYKQSVYYGPIAYIPVNEDLNFPLVLGSQDDIDDEPQVEFDDGQSRYKGSSGGRLFYSSTINNPFYKTATFTITSTVTTLGSVVICVPANNLVAVPSPTCAGRKKREADDSGNQFPIVPSKTLELEPTALPPRARESRLLSINGNDQVLDGSLVSTVEVSSEKIQSDNSREKRFFGGGIAASTTLTSYSFIAATVTSTVLLDPTGMNVAVCLPAGYIVC